MTETESRYSLPVAERVGLSAEEGPSRRAPESGAERRNRGGARFGPMLLAGALVATLSACAGHDWQRTGYETLESYGQAQCRKTMGEACEKREPYDRYQHRLRESEKGGPDR